jgi:hypothetical protein
VYCGRVEEAYYQPYGHRAVMERFRFLQCKRKNRLLICDERLLEVVISSRVRLSRLAESGEFLEGVYVKAELQ